jgi:phosphoglycerol transferase
MVDLEAFLSPHANAEEAGFIAEHYIDPEDVAMAFPEKKRNLIYIYLESMELTFEDEASGGIWNDNLIPELTGLAREGDTFAGTASKLNGAIVLPGTEWTMGAMFGQSSGTPLKLPFYGNFVSENMTDFFPGMTTIGDILEKEGYRQCLLIGSDASFGSRREFFAEHGYQIEVKRIGIPDEFVTHGTIAELRRACRMDAKSIAEILS